MSMVIMCMVVAMACAMYGRWCRAYGVLCCDVWRAAACVMACGVLLYGCMVASCDVYGAWCYVVWPMAHGLACIAYG